MLVSDVMTRDPECVNQETTLQEAAIRMKELDIGALPVLDHNRLAGVVTDRDITVRCISNGHDPRSKSVREAMTPVVVSCFEDQDVNEAADLMKDLQIRRLVVYNRQNELVGIVSLGDLAVRIDDHELASSALAGISTSSSIMV